MVYSIMGLCALFVCLIINKEILFKKHNLPKTYKIYRIYLIVTMFFLSVMHYGAFMMNIIIQQLYLQIQMSSSY